MCFEQNNTSPFRELSVHKLASDYQNCVFEFVYGTFQLFSGVWALVFGNILKQKAKLKVVGEGGAH